MQHPVGKTASAAEILSSVDMLGNRASLDDLRSLLRAIVVDDDDPFQRRGLPTQCSQQSGKMFGPLVGNDHRYDTLMVAHHTPLHCPIAFSVPWRVLDEQV